MTETIILKLLEIIGLPVIFLIIGWLAAKYLKPYVHGNAERLARAQEIAKVADEVTDYMLNFFPNAKWDDWLDQAVDRLIASAGLTDAEKAKQAVVGALARKAGDTETEAKKAAISMINKAVSQAK